MFVSDYASYPLVGFRWPPCQTSENFAFPSGGAGYWLNRAAMEIIANCDIHEFAWPGTTITVNGDRVMAEDCAVARILGKHGITIHGDARYSPEMTMNFPSPDNDLITTHRVSPDRMLFLQNFMDSVPLVTLVTPRPKLGAIVLRDGKKIQLDIEGNPIVIK
jgi:hypothetical protein